jgi:hypothetical protein
MSIENKPPQPKPQWGAADGREGRWRNLRRVINEAGDPEGALKWWLGEMAAGRALYRYHIPVISPELSERDSVCRVGGLHEAWFRAGRFTDSPFSELILGEQRVWMLEVFEPRDDAAAPADWPPMSKPDGMTQTVWLSVLGVLDLEAEGIVTKNQKDLLAKIEERKGWNLSLRSLQTALAWLREHRPSR